MAKILIVYSTTDGHTLKICRRLKQTIELNANQVELFVEGTKPNEKKSGLRKDTKNGRTRSTATTNQLVKYTDYSSLL